MYVIVLYIYINYIKYIYCNYRYFESTLGNVTSTYNFVDFFEKLKILFI